MASSEPKPEVKDTTCRISTHAYRFSTSANRCCRPLKYLQNYQLACRSNHVSCRPGQQLGTRPSAQGSTTAAAAAEHKHTKLSEDVDLCGKGGEAGLVAGACQLIDILRLEICPARHRNPVSCYRITRGAEEKLKAQHGHEATAAKPFGLPRAFASNRRPLLQVHGHQPY